MATIRRLTDSCVLVTTAHDATLFDPGTHTFNSGKFDLATLGDVSRVLITHEHADHVHPEFVGWLRERRKSLTVHCNPQVANLLGRHQLESSLEPPPGVTVEDVTHELTPAGTAPPNRAYTVEDTFTHPGDSYQPTHCGQVMALPLVAPWGSATKAVEFARRVSPAQIIPIHDFYLSDSGRQFIVAMVKAALEEVGIDLVPLDWGDSFTV